MPIHLVYHGTEEVVNKLIHGMEVKPMPGGCTVDTIRELKDDFKVVSLAGGPRGTQDALDFREILEDEQDAITRRKKLDAVLLVPEDLTVVNS